MKYIYKIIMIFGVGLIASCDKDYFSELNSNPSELDEPDFRFEVTKAIDQMYSDDYTVWFYNQFDYVFPWSQIATGTVGGANAETVVEMGPSGGQNIYPSLYANTRNVRAIIDALPEEDQGIRRAIRAMTFPIQIQPALTMTDNSGSMVYTEGALAPFTTPPLLTPKYDTQETLFNTWLEELNAAIPELLTSKQFEMGQQDLIYGGDYKKWAKFCNLLKLRIAARLINKDRARALEIAAEVANSPAGYMDDLNEDFIYHRGIKYQGTGNGQQPGIGGKNLIDFLVANKDPRLGVLFDKNSFNGEVVQAFIDAGKDLPPYVEQYVVLDGAGNFSGWSGPGEPWVRFHGVPLSPDAGFKAENDIYFNQNELYKIAVGDIEKIYTATSDFSERITRTGYAHTYPTRPGGQLLELRDDYPPLDVILGSSAETNLYLAEFKLLGANIPGNAQDYFDRGVTLSVQRMDILAKNHRFPYYDNDPVYSNVAMSEAGAIRLRPGQIDDLLAQPAYDLSSNGLEKVYIQQYINSAATPNDTWSIVRRSGIPMTGSTILPRDEFLSSGVELTIPRRFEIGIPTEDSRNFANRKAALEEQGFTSGTNSPTILNSERLWFDIGNPDYGAGPKN